MRIGKPCYGVNIVDELQSIAEEDETAGRTLQQSGHYRQATYFFLQAMEKHIKAKSYNLAKQGSSHYRQIEQGHDICDTLNTFLANFEADPLIQSQIKDMIDRYVLGDTNFRQLHNDLRYPFYVPRRNQFVSIEIGDKDCNHILQRLEFIKTFLRDMETYFDK